LRIGARNYSTHPTGQRACRQPANFIVAGQTLQLNCRPIRQHFEGTLQRAVDLGFARKERTPWAQTVRTCHKLLQHKEALWTFLEIHDVEPTNNAAERALRQSVIQRKISLGVQSSSGVRWSGFSGQHPSLTSEAGHRP
jgi:hypothetical protein